MKTFSEFLAEALKETYYPGDGAYEDFEFKTQEQAAEQFYNFMDEKWEELDSINTDIEYCPELKKDCVRELRAFDSAFARLRDKFESCSKKKYGKANKLKEAYYPGDGAYEDFEFKTQEQAAKLFCDFMDDKWDELDSINNDIEYCPELKRDCARELRAFDSAFAKLRDKFEACSKKKYGKANKFKD